MSIRPTERLRAVIPHRVSRRWNVFALRQLCEIVAHQAEQIERLRDEMIKSEECAEHWHEEALRLHDQLAEVSGMNRGITPQANLVLARPGTPLVTTTQDTVSIVCEEREYLFDMKLDAALRVRASSEAEAREKLRALLDCADTHFGELDGRPAIGEVSLNQEAMLAEVDGEAV